MNSQKIQSFKKDILLLSEYASSQQRFSQKMQTLLQKLTLELQEVGVDTQEVVQTLESGDNCYQPRGLMMALCLNKPYRRTSRSFLSFGFHLVKGLFKDSKRTSSCTRTSSKRPSFKRVTAKTMSVLLAQVFSKRLSSSFCQMKSLSQMKAFSKATCKKVLCRYFSAWKSSFKVLLKRKTALKSCMCIFKRKLNTKLQTFYRNGLKTAKCAQHLTKLFRVSRRYALSSTLTVWSSQLFKKTPLKPKFVPKTKLLYKQIAQKFRSRKTHISTSPLKSIQAFNKNHFYSTQKAFLKWTSESKELTKKLDTFRLKRLFKGWRKALEVQKYIKVNFLCSVLNNLSTKKLRSQLCLSFKQLKEASAVDFARVIKTVKLVHTFRKLYIRKLANCFALWYAFNLRSKVLLCECQTTTSQKYLETPSNIHHYIDQMYKYSGYNSRISYYSNVSTSPPSFYSNTSSPF